MLRLPSTRIVVDARRPSCTTKVAPTSFGATWGVAHSFHRNSAPWTAKYENKGTNNQENQQQFFKGDAQQKAHDETQKMKNRDEDVQPPAHQPGSHGSHAEEAHHGKSKQGFASMPKEKVQEIASMGGHASRGSGGPRGFASMPKEKVSEIGHMGGRASQTAQGGVGYSQEGHVTYFKNGEQVKQEETHHHADSGHVIHTKNPTLENDFYSKKAGRKPSVDHELHGTEMVGHQHVADMLGKEGVYSGHHDEGSQQHSASQSSEGHPHGRQGFASMPKEQVREIASKGGRSSHKGSNGVSVHDETTARDQHPGEKSMKGFASMSPERVREIASMGGHAGGHLGGRHSQEVQGGVGYEQEGHITYYKHGEKVASEPTGSHGHAGPGEHVIHTKNPTLENDFYSKKAGRKPSVDHELHGAEMVGHQHVADMLGKEGVYSGLHHEQQQQQQQQPKSQGQANKQSQQANKTIKEEDLE